MTICDNPESISFIELDDCVGNSLAVINTNFQLLKDSECLNYSDITEMQNRISDLNGKCFSLSANVLGIPKAFAAFDAITNGFINPLILKKSSNVQNVSGLSTGVFQLSFVPPLKNNQYAIIGSNFEPTYWVQPENSLTASRAVISILNQNGTPINPTYISVTIFNN